MFNLYRNYGSNVENVDLMKCWFPL